MAFYPIDGEDQGPTQPITFYYGDNDRELTLDVPIKCAVMSIHLKAVHPFNMPMRPWAIIHVAVICLDGKDVKRETGWRGLSAIKGLELLPNLSSFAVTGLPFLFFDKAVLFKLVYTLQLVFMPEEMWTKRLLALRCWKGTYPLLLNVACAMAPLGLPVYVLMWICDFLPAVASVPDLKKVRLLEGIRTSYQRILLLHDTPVVAARHRRFAKDGQVKLNSS
jgi:hypothetical protein